MFKFQISVPDPWHFGMDPDPRIRTYDLRIRLRILLFSSVTFEMPTKKFLLLIIYAHSNFDGIYIILQR